MYDAQGTAHRRAAPARPGNRRADARKAGADKLTRYLNDALIDLTGELQPRRTDELTLKAGELDSPRCRGTRSR